MKNFTPDKRAADANIENTRGRAKPDTGILWRICRRTYKCGVIGGKWGGNGRESEAGRGAAGDGRRNKTLQRAEDMDGMPCARKGKNTQYDRKS